MLCYSEGWDRTRPGRQGPMRRIPDATRTTAAWGFAVVEALLIWTPCQPEPFAYPLCSRIFAARTPGSSCTQRQTSPQQPTSTASKTQEGLIRAQTASASHESMHLQPAEPGKTLASRPERRQQSPIKPGRSVRKAPTAEPSKIPARGTRQDFKNQALNPEFHL